MSEQKRLDSFKKALEQSRKGEPLDLSEEEFELFSAIQNDGIANAYQKRLDRPDREKIVGVELRVEHLCGIKDGHTHLTPLGADKILALFLDTGAILDAFNNGYARGTKQVRQRIQRWRLAPCPHAPREEDIIKGGCGQCWQDLKEGK